MVAVNMTLGPELYTLSMSPKFSTAATMDATGEKGAWNGRFIHPDGYGTYIIQRVHFRWGSPITSAGGSAMTLSLQDVSLVSGTPIQPDGTPDHTVAIPNGDLGPANTWYRTGLLSSDRTVGYGELLSAVIEFDGAGCLGTDLVRTSTVSLASTSNSSSVIQDIGGGWQVTKGANSPTVLFECSDGSFGYLSGTTSQLVCSAFTATNFNSASTPDEMALAFKPDYTMTIGSLNCVFTPSASATCDLVIYDGTTAVHTQTINPSTQLINDNKLGTYTLSAPVVLTAGTQYYISLKPTSTPNTSRFYSATVYDGQAMRVAGWPATTGQATRVDGGAWSSIDTTILPLISLQVIDVATAGASQTFHPLGGSSTHSIGHT